MPSEPVAKSRQKQDEESLLVFLETQIVDHEGKVCVLSMNDTDFDIARRWNDEGFIKFGRIKFDDLPRNAAQSGRTYHVAFTDRAWKEAHRLRRERGERHVATIEEADHAEA